MSALRMVAAAWARAFTAAVVVVVGLALTGCGGASPGGATTAAGPAVAVSQGETTGDDAAVDGADGDETQDGTESMGDVADGDAEPEEAAASGSVPDGWPAAVKFVPGTIVDGFAVSGGRYMVTLALTEGGRAVFDAGADLLEQEGHAEVFRLVDDEESQSGNWTGDGYSVTLNVSTTDGEWFADYVVALDSDG